MHAMLCSIVRPTRQMLIRIMAAYAIHRSAIMTLFIASLISGLCTTIPTWATTSARQTVSLNGNDWLIYSGTALPNNVKIPVNAHKF
jgi:hypothetical protein